MVAADRGSKVRQICRLRLLHAKSWPRFLPSTWPSSLLHSHHHIFLHMTLHGIISHLMCGWFRPIAKKQTTKFRVSWNPNRRPARFQSTLSSSYPYFSFFSPTLSAHNVDQSKLKLTLRWDSNKKKRLGSPKQKQCGRREIFQKLRRNQICFCGSVKTVSFSVIFVIFVIFVILGSFLFIMSAFMSTNIRFCLS